jgi:uncharacterized protein YndB with AHSA1/START domain
MTTTKGTAKVTLPTELQILITREFDAPKELVWRAYTTPELVSRWWAGDKGTMLSAEIDLRVGGRWRYVMGGDGYEVAFRGEYREIQAPDRLVNTEVFEGLPDPDAHTGLITVTFSGSGSGSTYLEMLCEYDDQETRDAVIASGMEGGMQDSLDHLEAVAASL